MRKLPGEVTGEFLVARTLRRRAIHLMTRYFGLVELAA